MRNNDGMYHSSHVLHTIGKVVGFVCVTARMFFYVQVYSSIREASLSGVFRVVSPMSHCQASGMRGGGEDVAREDRVCGACMADCG